jgi:hypothetical protein
MKVLFASLLVLASTLAHAQWGDDEMDERAPWKERVFTGGGLGMSFGTNVDFISISPLIGYKVSPKVAAGLSLTYRYTNFKYSLPKISTNDFGVSPFVRYNFYQNFFLHAEYEYLNYELPKLGSEKRREAFSSMLAGGGFFQPLGKRAGFFLLALYNFSYRNPTGPTDLQPYDSPIIVRGGITAGF